MIAKQRKGGHTTADRSLCVVSWQQHIASKGTGLTVLVLANCREPQGWRERLASLELICHCVLTVRHRCPGVSRFGGRQRVSDQDFAIEADNREVDVICMPDNDIDLFAINVRRKHHCTDIDVKAVHGSLPSVIVDDSHVSTRELDGIESLVLLIPPTTFGRKCVWTRIARIWLMIEDMTELVIGRVGRRPVVWVRMLVHFGVAPFTNGGSHIPGLCTGQFAGV